MPKDLVLIRHGESTGNVAVKAEKDGDPTGYTAAFGTTPGHRWRLTDLGRTQAAVIGAWVGEQFTGFDRYYVSPYVRARETAGLMALPGALWRMNRALRERDWGDIGQLPRHEFLQRPEFRLNANVRRTDPLYWAAPNGESIAQVAEDRVRNLLSTLHREADGERVVAVSHGDWIWATRLVLERWSDEEFATRDGDIADRIVNCQALHYTRVHPDTGEVTPRLSWLRNARPVRLPDLSWTVTVTPWEPVGRNPLTNEEILAGVGPIADPTGDTSRG